MKHLHWAFKLIVLLAVAVSANAQAPKTKSGFVKTPDGMKIHYIEASLPALRLRDLGPFHLPQTGPGGTPPTLPGNPPQISPGQATTILFVPGWTMPAWIWEKQIAHFSKSTRVVAMDPRCQGESSQTTDGLSPASRARDIKAVVEQLHLAPVVLVGWSMGVGELVSYVDQFGTSDIAGLVLVDDAPGAEVPPEAYKDLLDFISGFVRDRRAATDPFVRSFFKKPQPEEYLKRVVEASLRTPTNTAVALLVGKFGTDLRPALKKINKPTLIVAAQSPFVGLVKAIQPQISGSRLEIFEGAGHALFVDDAERFNSLLEDFLKALQKRGVKQ